MSIPRDWKIVQVTDYGGSGTRLNNDHQIDFINVDNGNLVWYESIIPLPSGQDLWSYTAVVQIELTRKQRVAITSVLYYADNIYLDDPSNKVGVYAKVVSRDSYVAPSQPSPGDAPPSGYTLVHTNYYSLATALECASGLSLSNVGDKSNFLYLLLRAQNGALPREKLNFPGHFYPVK
jgi:hypothetical protein